MTKEYLTNEERRISGFTDRLAGDRINKNREPIYDGIINIDKYLSSKYKILWVLKEPYDEDNSLGGGWSLAEAINKNVEDKEINKIGNTFKMVAQITYSILNNLQSYQESKFPGINNSCLISLQQIALIDINKMPACKRSGDMTEEYNFWKPLLFWQLFIYNPDIIIFGNTFNYFEKDLRLGNKIMNTNSSYFIKKDNKLFIDVYHPCMKGEEYFNEINNIVNKNIE